MRDIRVGAAQFEARDKDKEYNLARIAELTRKAVDAGAEIVSFHECSISGYTFLQDLGEKQMAQVAEPVPDGPSTGRLIEIAREYSTVVMAGLVEVAGGKFYNTYITVSPDGYITKFSKLHPFVNPHLTPGAGYNVIDLCGAKVGFLICYDNNLGENNRITALMGAEIIFMPHVTCCLPSAMPGRGPVDKALWDNRDRDPVSLRMEFMGPKGLEWLNKFIPTRCYENGVYGIFTNPVGVDYDTIKPGLAMIIDPYGEIQELCTTLGDDVIVGLLTDEKLSRASGRQRYIPARRPDLYGKLVEPPADGSGPVTRPGWKRSFDKDAPKT